MHSTVRSVDDLVRSDGFSATGVASGTVHCAVLPLDDPVGSGVVAGTSDSDSRHGEVYGQEFDRPSETTVHNECISCL